MNDELQPAYQAAKRALAEVHRAFHGRRDLLRGAVETQFPWMVHLSGAERDQMVREMLESIDSWPESDRLITGVIRPWQATAEAYAAGIPRDGSDLHPPRRWRLPRLISGSMWSARRAFRRRH